jgi:alpha-glucosidase
MQWTPDGGFTTSEPWLPYSNLDRNVADEASDPMSLLSLYRRLIWFRRGSDALRWGSYQPIDGVPNGIVAYIREAGDERLLAVLNFTSEPRDVLLPDDLRVTTTIVGTHSEPSPSQQITLAGNEARLLRLG